MVQPGFAPVFHPLSGACVCANTLALGASPCLELKAAPAAFHGASFSLPRGSQPQKSAASFT